MFVLGFHLTWLNRFLANESAKLDLIIRRCKRITGVLIILKKYFCFKPFYKCLNFFFVVFDFLNAYFFLLIQYSFIHYYFVFNRLSLSPHNCDQPLHQKSQESNANDSIQLKCIEELEEMRPFMSPKKLLLKNIQSVEPETENQRLAIEVNLFYMNNFILYKENKSIEPFKPLWRAKNYFFLNLFLISTDG